MPSEMFSLILMRRNRKAESYTVLVGRHPMNRGVAGQPSIEQQFFSQQNSDRIATTLLNDYQQRLQQPLGTQEQTRLSKTVKHYMQEVWDVNGPLPVPQLNREVLTVTAQDFGGYLRRSGLGGGGTAAAQRIVSDPTNNPRMEFAQQRVSYQQGVTVQPRPTFENSLLLDTGSRFEQLQQERNGGGQQARPTVPKFEISLTSSGDEPSALSLYETAKKAREEEASRAKPVGGSANDSILGDAITDVNPLQRFMSPPSLLGDANANPTLAVPVMTPAPRGPLPQDYLIKQDDIISYRETEYNLVVYSADRDWLNNTKENRYNFSVVFDPGNNKQGFYYNASSNKKFKNIVRIELVKAILPTEGLQPLVQYDTVASAYTTSAKLNILSYPYILVHIPELDTNNYGTDNHIDNSFAALQYDANWYTDTTNLEDGYIAMIPKFMKCQKVYAPTPLATLTKLTIQLQLPNGESISSVSDTISIQNIYLSGTAIPPPAAIVSAKYRLRQDTNTNGEYIFIQTSTYFSKWQFAEGNRIQIQGLDPTQVPGGNTAAAQALIAYLQDPNGIPIIDIAYTSGADGANSVGYANLIIVRTPHVDPTTGSVLVQPFGGTDAAMDALATSINAVPITTITYGGAKILNLSHQTNLVLRIITREMDPAGRVRPDNL
jgi:hypothetical protein